MKKAAFFSHTALHLFFIQHSLTDRLSSLVSLQREKKEGKKDKDEKEEEAGKRRSPAPSRGGGAAEGTRNPSAAHPTLCSVPIPGPPCGPICSNEQVEKLLGAVKPEIQTLKEKLNTVGRDHNSTPVGRTQCLYGQLSTG